MGRHTSHQGCSEAAACWKQSWLYSYGSHSQVMTKLQDMGNWAGFGPTRLVQVLLDRLQEAEKAVTQYETKWGLLHLHVPSTFPIFHSSGPGEFGCAPLYLSHPHIYVPTTGAWPPWVSSETW